MDASSFFLSTLFSTLTLARKVLIIVFNNTDIFDIGQKLFYTLRNCNRSMFLFKLKRGSLYEPQVIIQRA